MKVNVRLCGAIPRSEWTRHPDSCQTDSCDARLTSCTATNALANAPTAISSKSDATIGTTTTTCSHDNSSSSRLHPPFTCTHKNVPSHNNKNNNTNNTNNSSSISTTTSSSSTSPTSSSLLLDTTTTTPSITTALMPMLEPPSWAVPAAGDARLEPVCEALGNHTPVDLTTRSVYRIGRSPASDVQLLHGTSSRRHAMMFHHPNGSCYIVDCGSAHGTYVNGHRIVTKTTGNWVVPHKVRRGSLIRFGGPGAPAFVLKSFAIGFSAMVSLDEEDEDVQVQPKQQQQQQRPTSKWLVQVNTRLNALGRSSVHSTGALTETSANVMKEKRNIMSLSASPSFEDQNNDCCLPPCSKRPRCMSPPLSPEAPIRLVSPDSNSSLLNTCTTSTSTKRVHFQDAIQPFYPALVSPEEWSDNEDSAMTATTTLIPCSSSL